MKKRFRIVELFSGIGSQASALKNIGFNLDVVATCEWDMHAFVAYDLIHNGKNILKETLHMNNDDLTKELSKYTLSADGKKSATIKSIKQYNTEILRNVYSSIHNTNNLVDISRVDGKQMPDKIDLLTYSFPCQDLSNVGSFHGYTKGIEQGSGSRSSLLWEVGRILEEMKKDKKDLPRYLVMENVPTLLSKKHKQNFEIWIDNLNYHGYVSKHFLLNASQFGIPQNRPRLIMLSVFVGENNEYKNKILNYFKETDENKIVSDYRSSKFFKKYSIDDLLRTDYKNEKYYFEALECVPNNTPSRQKIWDENPKILDKGETSSKRKYVRTITTKQDRHPNSGNLYFYTKDKDKCNWRYLTPRECLLFMGFKDEDYESLINNNISFKTTTFFPRDKIIRMAGNSIPVKLLEGVFYQLYILEKITQ